MRSYQLAAAVLIATCVELSAFSFAPARSETLFCSRSTARCLLARRDAGRFGGHRAGASVRKMALDPVTASSTVPVVAGTILASPDFQKVIAQLISAVNALEVQTLNELKFLVDKAPYSLEVKQLIYKLSYSPEVRRVLQEIQTLNRQATVQALSVQLAALEPLLKPIITPLSKSSQELAKVITIISRDSDKDLFNGYPFNVPALGLWAASLWAFSSSAFKDDDIPYGPGQYDPIKAEKYYTKRWALKFGRAAQLFWVLGGWGIRLARDKYEYNGDNWEKNMPQRAKEILQIIYRLGTTAIKIGQALSVREDLLPSPYVRELRELQDRVPPFPTPIARRVMEEQLAVAGQRGALSGVFSELSAEPVAAASIAQVYKARLPSGEELAVKVQRPGVLLDIALDLHMCRTIAPIYKSVFKLNSDVLGLVDEWGRGFVNELDYLREAANSRRFLDAMRARGLDAVTTAEVYAELSTGTMLVTSWVEGERLDESRAGDVGRLCGLALNAYLTMLLDTGLLHCDPHPGNLLRTTDGRLCILDFGMCVEVEPDLQYALLDYIAHLTAENYAAIPGDLIRLGFVPRGQEAAISRAGVVEILSTILRQLAQGGGPRKVQERMMRQLKEEYGDLPREELRQRIRERMQEMNRKDATAMLESDGERVSVAAVARKMEELQENNNLFQIPPWMAYILRTFSVLEGVGLAQDDDYSIVQECYPYLARRLFLDNSPRAQGALRQMLYGADGAALNVERLAELTRGFETYTASTTATTRSQGLEIAAGQAAELLLAPGGNFIQQVLMEELGAVLDAGGREALDRAARSAPGALALGALRGQAAAAAQLPGPLRALLTPVLLPGELALGAYDLLAKDGEDEVYLKTARALLDVVQSQRDPLIQPDAPSGVPASATVATAAGAAGGGGGGLFGLGGGGGGGAGGAGGRGGALLAELQGLGLPRDAEGVRRLAARAAELRPGISASSARFGSVLVRRAAGRLQERLDVLGPLVPDTSRRAAEAFISLAERVDDLLVQAAAAAAAEATETAPAKAAGAAGAAGALQAGAR